MNKTWDFQNESAILKYDDSCLADLRWWSEERNLTPGVSLRVPSPDALLYSDASDTGWGASLEGTHVSGLWQGEQSSLSINARELLAVELALESLHSQLHDLQVAFVDNSTALAYLKKAGGTRSQVLNDIAQRIFRKCEEWSITLLPQFIPGKLNVMADTLSRRNQTLGSEWTLHQEVVDDLIHRWPANIDLFATAINFRLPAYSAP